MARVFLDTNIFLYAIGRASPHRETCRELLEASSDGTLEAVTSTEVLQEILHVRSRRVDIRDAVEAVRAAAGVVREVLPVEGKDVLVACEMIERHPTLGARDALHVAVMKNRAIHLLASVDSDFDVVEEVKRLDPVAALRLAGVRGPR